jgi:hypothetical protein
MSSSTEVRNQIGPLLDRLIHQLDDEGSATQRAYFARIRTSLYRARHDWDLATPIRELSTTSAVGFTFSSDADALIARILEKADALASELDAPKLPPH